MSTQGIRALSSRQLALVLLLVLALAAAPAGAAITVTPAAVSIAPGQTSAPITVNFSVRPSGMEGGTGSLVFRTLPPGITTFPATITYSYPAPPVGSVDIPVQATATFRFVVSAQAPAGTYQLVLREASLGAGTASITVTVQAAGDVSISFSPPTLELCREGPAARGTVTLTPSGGYGGQPTAWWSGAPGGIAIEPARFDFPALAGPRSATFSVRAAAGAPANGSVNLTVRDTSAGIERTRTLPFVVRGGSFNPSVAPSSITLEAGGQPATFQARIAADSCFSSPQVSVMVSGGAPGLEVTPGSGVISGPGYAPATFSVKAAPTLAAGSYDLAVAFPPDGERPRVVKVTVEVRSVPGDFAVTLRQPTLTLCAGQRYDGTATITPQDGYAGRISARWTTNPPALAISPESFAAQALPPGQTLPFALAPGASVEGSLKAVLTATDASRGISRAATLDVTVRRGAMAPAVSPSSLAIAAGDAGAALTAAVNPGQCWLAPAVAVAVSGVPAGVSVTPSTQTASAPGWGPLAFTVAATPSAQPGTSTLVFTFTPRGDEAARTVEVPLTVEGPRGDFTIALDPPALELCDGGPPAQATAVLTPQAGYSGSVALSWAGVPQGLSVTPRSLPGRTLPPGATVSVSLQASRAAPGAHTLTMSATDATRGVTRSATLNISVTAPSYTPVASPSAMVVQAGGGTGTLRLDVQAGRCFSASTVDVEVSGAPAGVSFAPAALTLTPPAYGPVSLEVTVGHGVAAGTYPLQVAFRPRGVPPQTVPVQLMVTAEPDFQLSVEPGSASLHAGQQVEVAVSATALNGLSGPIVVTAGVPAGVSVVPSSFALQPGVSQEVVVHTERTPGLAQQTRTVTFTGTNPAAAGPRSAELRLVVLPPLTLERVEGPRVDIVTPDRLPVGSTATLDLVGKNLLPGTAISFGSGVTAIEPPIFLSPTEARLKVQVAPTAVAGRRLAQASSASGSNTGPGGLLLLPFIPPTRPILTTGCESVTRIDFTQGQIRLEKPFFEPNPRMDVTGEWAYLVPLLDDAVTFEWQEAQPGTAEYFVVRFLTKAGKPFLDWRVGVPRGGGTGVQIAPPRALRAGPDFLEAFHAAWAARNGGANQPFQIYGSVMGSGFDSGIAEENLALADLLWQVVGYRSYDRDCVIAAPDASLPEAGEDGRVHIPVSSSPYWALRLPDPPTGKDCPEHGGISGELHYMNQNPSYEEEIDENGEPVTDPNGEPKYQPVFHPYDSIYLEGTLSFADSPWHPVAKATRVAETSGGGTTYGPDGSLQGPFDLRAAYYTLSNLFVDWGDGTVSRVHRVRPAHPEVGAVDNPDFCGADNVGTCPLTLPEPCEKDKVCVAPMAPTHRYTKLGDYTIRVFVLAGEDADNVDLADLGRALDRPESWSGVVTAGTSGSSTSSAPSGGGASQTGGSSSGKAQPATSSDQVGGAAGGAHQSAVVPASWADEMEAANRMYMLYCAEITISHRKDPVAEGPLELVSISVDAFPSYEGQGQVFGGGIVTPVSGCDEALVARGTVRYYGDGYARMTWHVDDLAIPGPVVHLASPIRELGPDEDKWPPPERGESPLPPSPIFPVDPPGLHTVYATAIVVPKPTQKNVEEAVEIITDRGWGGSGIGGTGAGTEGTDTAGTGWTDAALQGFASSVLDASGTSVGVLAPASWTGASVLEVADGGGGGAAAHGAAVTSQASTASAYAGVEELGPPLFVKSTYAGYFVQSADPNVPCTFLFPTRYGDFKVSGLQLEGMPASEMTKDARGRLVVHRTAVSRGGGALDEYTGVGKLVIPTWFAGDVENFPAVIPVDIDHWRVPDMVNVAEGSLDTHPSAADATITGTGFSAEVKHIAGTADAVAGELALTFEVTPSSNAFIAVGGTTQPTFTATAPIHGNGDWYAENGPPLPKSLIGHTGFRVFSDGVILDWSIHDGAGGSPRCGATGPQFLGINLGEVTVLPNLLGLWDAGAMEDVRDDWVIDDTGCLCGDFDVTASPPPLKKTMFDGWVSVDRISGTVTGGELEATYHDFKVKIPWPDTTLAGDAVLDAEGGIDLTGAVSEAKTETYGADYQTITLSADNFRFNMYDFPDHPVWGVAAETSFDFEADDRHLTSVNAGDIVFDFHGWAYHRSGEGVVTYPLSGGSSLGDTALDLVSIDIEAPGEPTAGKPSLGFAIASKAHLATGLPEPDMEIDYAIRHTHQGNTGTGPKTLMAPLEVSFPPGSEALHASINAAYEHGSTRFVGPTDLSLFGGPALPGGFLLGYENDEAYWIVWLDFPLQGAELPVAPPFLYMSQMRGGFAHNFSEAVLRSYSQHLGEAQPDFSGDTRLFAQTRMGSPGGGFIYTFDGELFIDDGGAHMDIDAWLLKNQHALPGDLQGYFDYHDGTFDGALYRDISFGIDPLSIGCNLGQTEDLARLRIHAGGDEWYLHAGTPEAPIECHFLYRNASGYLMLGTNDGLKVGASTGSHLEADAVVLCGFLDGSIGGGLDIAPEFPPRVTGTLTGHVAAGVELFCIDDVGFEGGIDVAVSGGAWPPNFGCEACFDFSLFGEYCGNFNWKG